MTFDIHGTYMSVLYAAYMPNAIYVTYIVHIQVCMYVTYMHHCIYAYIYLLLYVHICEHNISIIYDIWHTWYIYVSTICSIYAKCHICYLYCPLTCACMRTYMCTIYVTYMAFRIYAAYICQYYTGNICQITYMWAQYKYHIWHLTYMVHICQFYMQHICQMPYMLLILSTHMCMYEDIYVHNIRNIYGISHICCIYASTTRGIYVKWHICGHNISIIYDIWHTWYIYVSTICSIYAKCHICYLYCPLTCAYMRTYMCTIYVTYMAFRIYVAYMPVLHGEYMSNDIYVGTI
jgi:hypothetical protein